jgi:formate C-acetyltransferase
VNVAKTVELVLNGGCDFKSGRMCGLVPGKIESFDDFLDEIKKQIKYFTQKCITNIKNIERYYSYTNPDPLLSCQYEDSVKRGIDVYEGGAKYNNSSMYFYCIASLIDSLCAVKKIVFDDKLHTLEELSEILRSDWKENPKTRLIALTSCEKYGNNTPLADALTKDVSDFCAGLVNNVPNSRGGVFKAAIFSIDWCFRLGHKTMATPDGRLAGDPLSKNLCATLGMDKKGITALISSVTKIDHAAFPTGSVLDIVLHPSAVMGDDGLDAFYAIVMTYFNKGGFALHGNVFDADDLIRAQKNPERYENMQVRLCGWNAYFVNLSKEEQDSFIKQAKNAQ